LVRVVLHQEQARQERKVQVLLFLVRPHLLLFPQQEVDTEQQHPLKPEVLAVLVEGVADTMPIKAQVVLEIHP
jgi:hypothetical protein